MLSTELTDLSELFKVGNILRIDAVKERGRRMKLCGRVLRYDSKAHKVLIYDLDYKRVENLSLNEIEDVICTA